MSVFRRQGLLGTKSIQRDAQRIKAATPTDPLVAYDKIIAFMRWAPGIRGFWLGAHDLALQQNFSLGATPFITNDLGGTFKYWRTVAASSEYLYTTDPGNYLRVTGTEAVFGSTLRGLTIGGWFYRLSSATTSQAAAIGKWNPAGSASSYLLYTAVSTEYVNFAISSTGTSTSKDMSTSVAMPEDQWVFLCAQFDPSAYCYIWINGTKYSSATTVSSLHANASYFCAGARDNGGSGYWDGAIGPVFCFATYLDDSYIKKLYYLGRIAFGTA